MSLIAKNNEGQGFEPLTEGVHMAVCSQLIDLGLQPNSFKEGKFQDKVMIVWETDETYIKDEVEHNRTISKEYTTSLDDKANLKKTLQAWRGQPFTEEELKGFQLKNVLSKGCQLQIIHETKNDKTYANIAAIMALPKGIPAMEVKDLLTFDIEDKSSWLNWIRIPEWIQNKIKLAENYESSGLKEHVDMFAVVENADDKDLPF